MGWGGAGAGGGAREAACSALQGTAAASCRHGRRPRSSGAAQRAGCGVVPHLGRHQVLEAAHRADDGHGAVARGRLGHQPARLKAGRDQHKIGGGHDPVRQLLCSNGATWGGEGWGGCWCGDSVQRSGIRIHAVLGTAWAAAWAAEPTGQEEGGVPAVRAAALRPRYNCLQALPAAAWPGCAAASALAPPEKVVSPAAWPGKDCGKPSSAASIQCCGAGGEGRMGEIKA